MIATALLLAALAATPAERFALAHPASARVAAADGTRLVHASGLSVAAPRGAGPAESARSFLSAQGAAFGLAAGHELVLRSAPAAGRGGAVRFERRVLGLPVFGGDLVVAVDPLERVRGVNAGDAAGAPSGRHAIGERGAVAAALAAFPGGARGAGTPRAAAGWRRSGGQLRAAYRVVFAATEPSGDWRVFVDGATSAPLFVEPIRYRATAPASVYEVSPAETASALCPLDGITGAHTFCASPVAVTLQNLLSTASLAGTQATVYNCRGQNAPSGTGPVPGACTGVASSGGGFSFAADTTWLSATDDFAAAMAYHHLDRHATFLKAMDPTLPGGPNLALNGSLPAMVNALQGGNPLDNAFYSGALDAMVFGQGTDADFAYDSSVIYHEFTHGVVSAWGGFALDIDELGGLDEPGAVNEGTADALSVALIGRSQIGAFPAAFGASPAPYFRDMDDTGALRTCKGDGTAIPQFGINAINGLDGEVHDDGEIWNGFYWEVHRGLESGGVRGCGGACPAAAAIQYRALQLAGGTSPTLGTYWQTFKAAADTLFPGRPEVSSYVDCVARRRGFDQCDRTVPVYQGETKLQFVRLRYSPFQMAIRTAGNVALQVCSANGTSTTIHARFGAPVAITALDGQFNGTFTEDGSTSIAQACSAGSSTVNLNGTAGTWYLLFESPGAFPGASPGFEIFKVVVQAGGATRPAPVTPATCSLSAFPVTASLSTVPPRGSATFTATGATGAVTWAIATNRSGGSIHPTTGVYTAGATGNVSDVVQATDSVNATATATIAVGPGVSIQLPSPSAATGTSLTLGATGGSGAGYSWSMVTSASGGTITAQGLYTAGPLGGVSDVVRVQDSLGNSATASIAVTGPTSGGGGGGGGGGCSTGGGGWAATALGLAALLGLRRARRGRA